MVFQFRSVCAGGTLKPEGRPAMVGGLESCELSLCTAGTALTGLVSLQIPLQHSWYTRSLSNTNFLSLNTYA